MNIQSSTSSLEDFKNHADLVILQNLYPLLRKAELEYGLPRHQSAVYIADQVMNLLAVYLGVNEAKIKEFEETIID